MKRSPFSAIHRPYTSIIDTVGGKRFLIRGDTEIGKRDIEHGIPSYPLISWSMQYCSKIKSFVDIGAHIGSWSIYLADHCSRVHSFEPQTIIHQALGGGIALNGIQNIKTYEVALGSTKMDGKHGQLHLVSADGTGSSMNNGIFDHSEFNYGEETVVIRSLDSYEFKDVGLLKINVSGSLLDILQGAIGTIERCAPTIIFVAESDDWLIDMKTEAMRLLKSVNYRVIPVGGAVNTYLAEPNF
jgi:FkbM family methyltransferase